jgi:hypothetical protein
VERRVPLVVGGGACDTQGRHGLPPRGARQGGAASGIRRNAGTGEVGGTRRCRRSSACWSSCPRTWWRREVGYRGRRGCELQQL